jgi:hypothetical protein
MNQSVVLFDLDDTLIVNEDSVAAAFVATCALAHSRHGIDPEVLHDAVRQRARVLWREAPTIAYCLAMGIRSGEGLWSAFPGEAPELAIIAAAGQLQRTVESLLDAALIEWIVAPGRSHRSQTDAARRLSRSPGLARPR